MPCGEAAPMAFLLTKAAPMEEAELQGSRDFPHLRHSLSPGRPQAPSCSVRGSMHLVQR